MQKMIYSKPLAGIVDKIYSKSYMHRLIICFFLSSLASKKESFPSELEVLRNFILKESNRDNIATFIIMEKLTKALIDNHVIKYNSDLVLKDISGKHVDLSYLSLNCDESASTLRMIVPIACFLNISCKLEVDKALYERVSIDDFLILKPILDCRGLIIIKESNTVEGQLKYYINITRNSNYKQSYPQVKLQFYGENLTSSQVVSGILMCSLISTFEIEVLLKNQESKQYIDITVDSVKKFGINVIEDSSQSDNHSIWNIYINKSNNISYPQITEDLIDTFVAGDWSLASFWICANFIMGSENLLDEPIKVTNLDFNDEQGDKVLPAILRKMKESKETLSIDCKNIPDIAPILIISSCFIKSKKFKFENLGRLRKKESNRLEASKSIVQALGGIVKVIESTKSISLEVSTPKEVKLNDNSFSSFNDHRIAMILAILSTGLEENTKYTIDNALVTSKSYPRFWDDFIKLGGQINGI